MQRDAKLYKCIPARSDLVAFSLSAGKENMEPEIKAPVDKPEASTDKAQQITGAAPGQLAQQAEEKLKKPKATARQAAPSPDDILRAERKQKALERFTKKIAASEVMIPVIFSGDIRWKEKATEKMLNELAEDWQLFLDAWGIDMAGPVMASISLAIGHAQMFAEIRHQIALEDATKPDTQKK